MWIRVVKEQTEALCEQAIEEDPTSIQYIRIQSVPLCLQALEKDINVWRLIQSHNRTQLVWSKIIRKSHNFKYIPDFQQTEKLCLLAVARCGKCLRHVKIQTPKICLTAVNRCGEALKYVKEQSQSICNAAFLKEPDSEQYSWIPICFDLEEILKKIDGLGVVREIKLFD